VNSIALNPENGNDLPHKRLKRAEMGNSKENLHAGHRARLRKRFFEEGLDAFEDHQVIELLLFYAIPRRDTNEIAHLLLRRYGSFDDRLGQAKRKHAGSASGCPSMTQMRQ
jgi:DNA repair protein RadC